MCFNCPDVIDVCGEDECGKYVSKYRSARWFEAGDRYCRHLEEEYGHPYAEWSDRYDDED